MTDRRERFDVGDRPRIEVSNTSGHIAIVAGDPGVIDVAIDGSGDNYTVEQYGSTVVVRPEGSFLKRIFSADIVVRVPGGTDVEARNASGDVSIDVDAGELDVATASGDIRVRAAAGTARLKVASGDISLDHVAGSLDVISASGDVRVVRVDGDVAIKSASGDASVATVGGNVSLSSASGTLRVGRLEGEDVQIRTLSGDVVIGIPPRRRIELDMQSMSGDLRNRLPEGDGSLPEASVSIKASSVSGDVTIQGASA
jgi:DUF4097 and DUF4098 domain-containing protein YvlB